MRAEDMILVSVDDHVVEPPDLFEGGLPPSGPTRPRRSSTKTTGPTTGSTREPDPEHRAERGRRPPARGVRDGAHLVLGDA